MESTDNCYLAACWGFLTTWHAPCRLPPPSSPQPRPFRSTATITALYRCSSSVRKLRRQLFSVTNQCRPTPQNPGVVASSNSFESCNDNSNIKGHLIRLTMMNLIDFISGDWWRLFSGLRLCSTAGPVGMEQSSTSSSTCSRLHRKKLHLF